MKSIKIKEEKWEGSPFLKDSPYMKCYTKHGVEKTIGWTSVEFKVMRFYDSHLKEVLPLQEDEYAYKLCKKPDAKDECDYNFFLVKELTEGYYWSAEAYDEEFDMKYSTIARIKVLKS